MSVFVIFNTTTKFYRYTYKTTTMEPQDQHASPEFNNRENPQTEFPTDFAEPSWQISRFAVDHLYQIARWAGFLATVGLIAIGLSALMLIFLIVGMGTIAALSDLSDMGGAPTFGFIFSLIILLFYALPLIWLYNFSKNVKTAVRENEPTLVEPALNYLRKHYKFIGVLTAIVLGFYAITILFALFGVIIALFMGT